MTFVFSFTQYSRSQNPTRFQLETSLASLEGGAGALAFASGSAATAAAVMSLGLNAHILSVNDVVSPRFRSRLLDQFLGGPGGCPCGGGVGELVASRPTC